jgi:alpha-mannosidase
VISSTSNAFRAFDRRYGATLPVVRGDWTPYWEDGAASSAAETTLNRASSERLTQAETLWAMLNPAAYPAAKFDAAWANVLLYSEHTWGAHCSTTQPSIPFTTDQWTIKQTYATMANLQSRQLLGEAVQSAVGPVPPTAIVERTNRSARVDVYNTSPWTRTEVVLIPNEASEVGEFVTDERGRPVPAQRLTTGELAVLVRDLPPYSGRRYTISTQGVAAAVEKPAVASGNEVRNAALRVVVDPKTGAVAELRAAGIDANLVDASAGHAVNEYLYLIGDDPAKAQRNGPVKVSVRENGPLVASLVVESDAPGCHKLLREVRVTAVGDEVELLNTVDKKRLVADNYNAKEGKESVHFAFPFNVPGGQVRIDAPLAVVRPELDQMPSACKNWLTAGRWGDVANADYGVTWITLDAPMVQVGGITATLIGSQTDPAAWRKTIEPTQKLYSWALNNFWHTNYRAYQEGPLVFRYVLRPHRGPCDNAEASRAAIAQSQPLVALPGRGAAPSAVSLVKVEPADVHVVALKPSDDGKALIVRLFGAGAKDVQASLTWPRGTARRVWQSDTSERRLAEISGAITVPAGGVVTLRAESGR